MSKPLHKDNCSSLSEEDSHPLAPLHKAKLILLDDSRAYLSGLREILKQYDCEVHTFTSHIEMLRALPDINPQLVLMDYFLKETLATDVIKKIRAVPEQNLLPIVIMTGTHKKEVLIDSFCAGAIDFIVKDHVVETLEIRLASVLKLKEKFHSHVETKQTEAIKSMIGTYKHEFGNKMLIIEGSLRQIKRKFSIDPESREWKSLSVGLTGFRETLKKLDQLRRYNEVDYSNDTKILNLHDLKEEDKKN